MIRNVEYEDLENLRLARNKWYKLGIFRQDHAITKGEQEVWFNMNDTPGVIINDCAYGKIYRSGEVSFYGFDEWHIDDLEELIQSSDKKLLFGECYQNNPFLHLWIEAGFEVIGMRRNRKCHEGKMYDSLDLEYLT